MRSYLIAFICCIVLLVVTTPIIGILLIDYQLNNKSIEWRKKSWNFEGIHYQDITHPKMSAQHMHFYFDWPPHIHFTDIHLLTFPSQNRDIESSNSSFIPLKITIENAYLPPNPILEEPISGELTPVLSLQSESLQVDKYKGSIPQFSPDLRILGSRFCCLFQAFLCQWYDMFLLHNLCIFHQSKCIMWIVF